MARRIFSGFTVLLFVLCLWTAYANVLSDDTAVRAQAGQLVRTAAGCGDKCRVTGMNGDRGMISETIAFDIDGKGQTVVDCRRSLIFAGEYACTITKP